MASVVCRTVNGGVHKLKDREDLNAFLLEVQEAEGKPQFVEDIDGRMINLWFVVEIWKIEEGAPIYDFSPSTQESNAGLVA